MDAVINEYLYPNQLVRVSEDKYRITYYLSRAPLEVESFYGLVHIREEILYDLSVNADGTIYWQNLVERRPGRPRLETGVLDRNIGSLVLNWRGNPGDHFLNASYEGHFESLTRTEPRGVNMVEATNWSEEGF